MSSEHETLLSEEELFDDETDHPLFNANQVGINLNKGRSILVFVFWPIVIIMLSITFEKICDMK